MLTDKEIQFMRQWEHDREGLKTVSGKIMRGLPMALLFSLPVILLVIIVYFFFPEWYTRISMISGGTAIAVLISVLGSTMFFAYFRMQYKCEVNEQHYRELANRETGSFKTNHKNQ